MDDGVGALHGRLHARRVGDVALDELAAEALEILGTTGVTDETPHGKLVRAQGGGYVPADETRGAGEQNHGFFAAASASAVASPSKFCQYRRRSRAGLALVLGAEPAGTVRCLGRLGHLDERELPDLHADVDRDRKVRDVRQLERHVAVPARVDEAGRRVDEEPEPPEASSSPRAARRGRREA